MKTRDRKAWLQELVDKYFKYGNGVNMPGITISEADKIVSELGTFGIAAYATPINTPISYEVTVIEGVPTARINASESVGYRIEGQPR